jgi:predicted ATP-binding protein involved in virulence
MKLKKVEWNNHPILGNLELDFSKSNGEIYDTIILAGENGTGKTTILETLSTFLNLGTFEPFSNIEYETGGNPYIAKKTAREHDTSMGFYARVDASGSRTEIHTNRDHNAQAVDSDNLDIRHFGCVYSKARSGFKTGQVKSATTQQLDVSKRDEDNTDDFTSLKQLIVDISSQDNAEFAEIGKTRGCAKWEEFAPTSKMYRFRGAFDKFFDKIKFDKVDETSQDEKKILFIKNGHSIPVDNLSTGEKQIVFRGAYLLKNSKNIDGGTVLLDEPELSMHPKWQKDILQYYRDLFKTDGHQTVQMLIATHSDYVISSALHDKDNAIVIVLTEQEGIITQKKIDAPSVLPTITSAETNYLAFGIATNDYHIELYGYLQQKESKETVKDCDEFIKNHSLYDVIKHVKQHSYTNSRTGKTTNYDTLPTYIRNAIDHPDPTRTFTEEELQTSIEFLIELCR